MAKVKFRERAIRAYLDPDSVGGLLRLEAPTLTRLFIGFLVLFLLFMLAAVFTEVKITARGRGLVRPHGGVFVVRAPTEGYVRWVHVERDQEVEAGAPLLRLDGPVVAPVAGRIDALPVRRGEYITQGAAIAKIIPEHEEPVGYLAIPARHRGYLSPGQAVRLSFDEHPASEEGFGRGTIRRVTRDLITPELSRTLLSEGLMPEEPSFLVEVNLVSLPDGRGGRGVFVNGMLFEGIIVVREQTLLTLLFRPLRPFFDH